MHMFEKQGERNRGGEGGRKGARERERGREGGRKMLKFNLIIFYCAIYVLPYSM